LKLNHFGAFSRDRTGASAVRPRPVGDVHDFEIAKGDPMSVRKIVPTLLFCAVLVLVCAALTNAQNIKAALAGRVTDPQGATLAGVSVTATDADRGVKRTVTTDANGAYFIPGLEPGRYTVAFQGDRSKLTSNRGGAGLGPPPFVPQPVNLGNQQFGQFLINP
jgi:hypothetical protein